MTTKQKTIPHTDKTSPALPPAAIETFALMQHDLAHVRRVLEDNLGARRLTLADLDVARVGRGGTTQFILPGPDGEGAAPEINGVIVGVQAVRRFWATPPEESSGGHPPDCTSDDGHLGVGVPGGDCHLCPHATWQDGGRPGCGERRLIYLLQQDDALPIVLDAPPSSVRAVDKFLLQLARVGLAYHAARTTFTLARIRSGSGFDFARVLPKLVARLAPAEAARAAAYTAFFGKLISKTNDERALPAA